MENLMISARGGVRAAHRLHTPVYAADAALTQHLAERQAQLAQMADTLKRELFGIDAIIDRTIDTLRAWYVMPELITRPVIVCLWGLTGTGKTQLVRRLIQLLGFHDRSLEVQMDGFSHGSGWRSGSNAIASLLGQSGISEGQPGILLLDEFQRYRTRTDKGEDIKVERYQDVWALLSDGRLSPPLDRVRDIEFRLASSQYDHANQDDEERQQQQKKPFQLDAWDARDLKELLKLPEAITDIMRWRPEQVQQRLHAFRHTSGDAVDWSTNYSKLLIFITGNLDEMYQHLAERVEDCDTDADVFHAWTRELGMIDVKKALGRRFRPEQIARLGHNHLVYPSLSRSAYERLIAHTCAGYVDELQASSGVRFVLSPALLAALYDNTVFPAQGTRPLFSGLHAVLGGALVDAALWVLQRSGHGAEVPLAVDTARKHLLADYRGEQLCLPLQFEVQALRERNTADFRTLVAVHEAGHGLIYGLLLQQPPQEIRINLASYEGGYNSYTPHKAYSKRIWRDLICVTLAGRAAEALVFGDEHVTTGAEHDYKKATENAARYVRHFGFGKRISRTDVTTSMDDNVNTDVAASNPAIEALLQEQMQRACQLLEQHREVFCTLVAHLLQHNHMGKAEFAVLTGLPCPGGEHGALEPYGQQWQAFAAK